jgi:LPS export ABC transporter protein LptC
MINPVQKIAAAFAVMFIMIGCQNEISEIKAITDPKLVPVQSTFNSSFTYSADGVVRTKIYALQMDQYVSDSSYLIAPNTFHIQFFDSLGQYTGAMHGNEAIFSQKSNTLWTKGGLVLENWKKEKLETNSLTFYLDSDLVYTPDFVKISSENSVLEGKGLRSNGSFSNYEINQTSGNFNTTNNE